MWSIRTHAPSRVHCQCTSWDAARHSERPSADEQRYALSAPGRYYAIRSSPASRWHFRASCKTPVKSAPRPAFPFCPGAPRPSIALRDASLPMKSDGVRTIDAARLRAWTGERLLFHSCLGGASEGEGCEDTVSHQAPHSYDRRVSLLKHGPPLECACIVRPDPGRLLHRCIHAVRSRHSDVVHLPLQYQATLKLPLPMVSPHVQLTSIVRVRSCQSCMAGSDTSERSPAAAYSENGSARPRKHPRLRSTPTETTTPRHIPLRVFTAVFLLWVKAVAATIASWRQLGQPSEQWRRGVGGAIP